MIPHELALVSLALAITAPLQNHHRFVIYVDFVQCTIFVLGTGPARLTVAE